MSQISVAALRPRHLLIVAFLFVYSVSAFGQDKDKPTEKDGKLIVDVMWGDINNTPATNVYVEAHGFDDASGKDKPVVLTMSEKGSYEATLSPGLYDVFVSEGTSTPRCRRVLIRPSLTTYWTLKLEIDDVYTNTQKGVSEKR